MSWFKNTLANLVKRVRIPTVLAPRVGQVWESGWNADRIKVEKVEVGPSGATAVFVSHECHAQGSRPGMPREYAFGLTRRDMLKEWQRRLMEEKRALVFRPETMEDN